MNSPLERLMVELDIAQGLNDRDETSVSAEVPVVVESAEVDGRWWLA